MMVMVPRDIAVFENSLLVVAVCVLASDTTGYGYSINTLLLYKQNRS